MQNKLTYYILALLAVCTLGCGTDNKKLTKPKEVFRTASVDSLPRDTIQLKESFNEEDLPVNEYLAERLKPIRKNFKRINSISNWTFIDTKELWSSSEGGEAKYYYQNGQLEKIVSRHFGESFQQLTEYYLMNGQLSFVFERSYKYNRPIYYNPAEMKENNDTEAFGFEKSEITEDRSYFEKALLLHQINNQDCGAQFAKDYLLQEQKRIKADFEELTALVAKNEISISIACGIIGYTSPEVTTLKKLDSLKNYETLRQKLFNGSDLEKLVVTIMLEEYHSSNDITLSRNEIETMKNIKKSTQKYSLCYTCTVHVNGTFADVFKRSTSKNQPIFVPYNLIRHAVLN